MNPAVTIIIPTLADRELLESCLACLQVELDRRSSGDEIILVDDSGEASLREWVREGYPKLRYLPNEANLGFARSLLAGVKEARHELVLALNPDVMVRPGCIEPLTETLLAEDVSAVSPYILLDGKPGGAEALPALEYKRGLARITRQESEVEPGRAHALHPGGIPVAFALGGAFIFRRAEFLEQPFDARFEPFYWEDVDWCQSALKAGRRVLVDPRAVVEHHHRGTISGRVPDELVRAAIEKNRLLFSWKHLDESTERESHWLGLADRLVQLSLSEEREELIWLLLALEQPFSD